MKTSETPESDHLFKTREDTIILEETQDKIYHSFASKALFYTNREIPDIHKSVAFISMRVRAPDEDDWKKLSI